MSHANEQQVPRLDEMDEKGAHRFLEELLLNLIPEEEYRVRHEDYVLEMPQSGEIIHGRENMRAFQERLPLRPRPTAIGPVAPGAGQGGTVGRRGGRRLWRR